MATALKKNYENLSPYEQDDDKRSLRRLSARDSSLFIAELESDAPPNKTLKEAVKKFRKRYLKNCNSRISLN